jgi:hypothetical protein
MRNTYIACSFLFLFQLTGIKIFGESKNVRYIQLKLLPKVLTLPGGLLNELLKPMGGATVGMGINPPLFRTEGNKGGKLPQKFCKFIDSPWQFVAIPQRAIINKSRRLVKLTG